ncbi:Protein of unknown function [Streptomyces sp. 2323.1]|uniref:DUF3800 domain-containing protein n=1 Tax=Streptomyces sp. 2323.1 TaxID=1938841 RepID=UPI000BB7B93C|nr:DUF3800 domain-containing protein [Streptomyces sp. 2323.1]SOE12139.1 Protein of unknown function [Streptomyces sp. 2323.1]
MAAFHVPVHFGQLPKLHVYVDETGDRGFSARSQAQSPFFAMTALALPQEDEWMVTCAAGGLRALVHSGQPQQLLKPIHWVEHFKAKNPQRRSQAAHALASIPTARVIHVIAHKETLHQDAELRRDKGVFYNYTTRLLLERVAYLAREWPGGKRLAIVRLGQVKHMDHRDCASYLDRVRSGETFGVPWQHIKWPPTWVNTACNGIQLADVHAGLLNSALSGNPQDTACAENLQKISHQLRRSARGDLDGYGIKVIGDKRFVTERAWWPDLKNR